MIDYVWIWCELIVRWVHVIAGIAWIGSSFYFIALDLSLKPGKNLPAQAHGQAWHCLLYTSPSPRDRQKSRMPSSA